MHGQSCIYFTIVIIIVAPEMFVPPDNTIVINGSEAVFDCTVIGDPLPSISWFVSEVNLSLSNELMTPFNEQGRIDNSLVTDTMINSTTIMSTLRLNQTVLFIAGNYTCRASNGVGDTNRTATLTVHGK